MFRLLGKFLQAPHHTLVAALSLRSHLSSWLQSRPPSGTLPGCLLKRRLHSLSISHSLQCVISSLIPCALLHAVAHRQGTVQALLLTQAPLTLSSSLTQHPTFVCLGEGTRLFCEHIHLCSVHIEHLLVLRQFMLLHIFDPSHKLFPLSRTLPMLLPALTHTTLPDICTH